MPKVVVLRLAKPQYIHFVIYIFRKTVILKVIVSDTY